ncbi:MAG: hypothetical protein RLY86_1265 [Pseudomonadota bacterium]|jgi:adenylate cyclase
MGAGGEDAAVGMAGPGADAPCPTPPDPSGARTIIPRTITWLLTAGAEAPDIPALLHLVGDHLRGDGVPLDRISLHLSILHPLYRGLTFIWRAGRGEVETIYREHGIETTPGFHNSPVSVIREEGAYGIRVQMGRVPPPYPFSIIDDLVAEGFTDYVGLPLVFGGGQRNVATFASTRTAGFHSDHIALIHDVLPALAAMIEVRVQRLAAVNLLDVYVGAEAGQRILKGDIRRGTGLSIAAVLWYCDLRGFTGLADRLPMDQLIALLNNYFDIMGGAVDRRGGEILKFIGDAMLAIFPVDRFAGEAELQAKAVLALDAAAEAMAGMRRLNAQRAAWGMPKLGAGIALHVGDVLYGNIGATTRLDFTVIGPAVNLVTRLEGLTRRFDRRLLTSAAFAAALDGLDRREELISLGAHPVKGLDRPVEVFGLSAEGTVLLDVVL